MADGRMLKKKIRLDVRWADLKNDSHRLLFTVGIAHLDIDGRISGDPREFKAAVAPMLDHISREVVLTFFHDAERLGLIWRYQVEGRWVVQYPAFSKNQNLRPEKEAKSQYPPPPPDYSPGIDVNGFGELRENSGSSPGVGSEHSGGSPEEALPLVNQANGGKHLEEAGRQSSNAGSESNVTSFPKTSETQQHDIIYNNYENPVGLTPCSGTTPGVIREDSGRTPAEVKLSEVKRREVNVQASACVIGEADDPPSPSSSSQLKPTALVELWNELGCRPLVSELTDERRRKAGLRLRKRGDPDWWKQLFEKVKVLNKPWLTFDFLMRNDTNCLKVLEGNYDHDFKANGSGRSGGPRAGPAFTGPVRLGKYASRTDREVIDNDAGQ